MALDCQAAADKLIDKARALHAKNLTVVNIHGGVDMYIIGDAMCGSLAICFSNTVLGWFCNNNEGFGIDHLIPGDKPIKISLLGKCEGRFPVMNWFTRQIKTLDMSKFEGIEVTSFANSFALMYELKDICFGDFDTSEAVSFLSMFMCCESLETIDLSKFNTSKVEDTSHMFEYCAKLKSLDLSNFSFRNLSHATSMFEGCTDLGDIKFSTAVECNDSDYVTLDSMFCECSHIESIDISCIKTENVYDMSKMFFLCRHLENIVMPNISCVKNVCAKLLFNDCKMLKNVDARSLDIEFTTKLDNRGTRINSYANWRDAFNNCEQLEELRLNSIKIVADAKTLESNIYCSSINIFKGCKSLKKIYLHKKPDSCTVHMLKEMLKLSPDFKIEVM